MSCSLLVRFYGQKEQKNNSAWSSGQACTCHYSHDKDFRLNLPGLVCWPMGTSAQGSIDDLDSWWINLSKFGPDFGYFINAPPQRHDLLSSIYITMSLCHSFCLCKHQSPPRYTLGEPHLGAVVGTMQGLQSICHIEDGPVLSSIGLTQPRTTFVAHTVKCLTNSISKVWNVLVLGMKRGILF